MLRYSIKNIPNVNPLKPKIMKLTYNGKYAFNINGTTIHSTLVIPLNKNFNELKALSDEKHDSLTKHYDQLHLLIIDEISLVSNRMLSFIDRRLWIIKQVHNQFMGGLDVIMIGDFYQTLLFWDSWIFLSKNIGFNILATNFWHENVKCYKLHKIMKQNDVHFISILNRFQIASQTNEDIHFINDFYLKPPPMDNTLPHLFYTNLKSNAHNKIVYDKTPGKTFKFLVRYSFWNMSFSFQIVKITISH